MIEIKLIIDDIDYSSVAKLVTRIVDKKEEQGMLGKYIPKSALCGTVNGVLNLLAKEQKDEAVVKLISKHEDQAANVLQKIVANKGIKCKVMGVSARRIEK